MLLCYFDFIYLLDFDLFCICRLDWNWLRKTNLTTDRSFFFILCKCRLHHLAAFWKPIHSRISLSLAHP